jgi:nucleoside-diphosphate-sugar epimerase
VKVLVTGATGLVGCHTVAELSRAGCEVRALVRSAERLERAIAPFALRAVEPVLGDVTGLRSVRAAVAGCDAVVHAAGIFSIDRSRERELWRVNVRGAEQVLREALAAGADPVVHVSSFSALHPASGPVLTADEPVKEPEEMYAATKASAERYARALQAQGAPVVIFYPGAIWGPADPTVGDGVQAVIEMLRMGSFVLHPGGLPLVDARDLAAAIRASLRRGQGPRRYTAGGHFLTSAELADLLAAITGRRLPRVRLPSVAMRLIGHLGDIAQRFGVEPGLTSEAVSTAASVVPSDDSALARELGIRARPAHETLRDTLAWLFETGRLSAAEVGRVARSARGAPPGPAPRRPSPDALARPDRAS